MGLDITAYEGLAFVAPGQGLDEDGKVDYASGYSRIYVNPDFPAHGSDLPDPCVFSDSRASHSFRAGSYSGYGVWREALAELAGYPAVDDGTGRASHAMGAWAAVGGPFHEIINFSDCEGAIGPRVSAKLSADFEAWRPKAQAFSSTSAPYDEWFIEVYEDFAKSFAMAAQGGAVCFH